MDDPSTKTNSSPNGSGGRQVIRSYPRAIVILCIIVSLINPLLAPAVFYFILRSRRSWSKSRYSMTYRLVNKAAGLAIVGILVTGIALVIIVVFCSVIPMDNKILNTRHTLTVSVPEAAVNVTASTPEMVIHEFQNLKINSNTSASNTITHIENVSDMVAGTHVITQYLNDTHRLIIDERTNTKKLLRIPETLLTKSSIRRRSTVKSSVT